MTDQPSEATPVPPDREAHLSPVHTAILDTEEAIIRLCDRARYLLMQAVAEGYLCADGTSRALTEWSLQPLPTLWPVTASLTATMTVIDEDPDMAGVGREEIRAAILDRLGADTALLHLQARVSASPDGTPQARRVEASATVMFGIKAITRDVAVVNARLLLQGVQDRVTLAIDPDGPWRVGNRILLSSELDPDIDAPPTPHPRPAPDTIDTLDGNVAQAVLDLARRHLALARAAIRTTTLRFVRSVRDVDTVYERAEVFLTELGMDPLPRAYRIDLHASVAVLMLADDLASALTRCWEADQATTKPPAPRLSLDTPRLLPEAKHIGGGVWHLTFEHTMQAWIRGAADLDTAKAEATALAVAYLTELRPATEPVVTITAESPQPVIDHLLNPVAD